jgi:hypothetical protein
LDTQSPSSIDDFDDSGYLSDDKDVFFSNQTATSRPTKINTSTSPLSSEYTAPKTPQKVSKPVSMDSGISMSYDQSDEAQTRKSTTYRDGSESPLAGKGLPKGRVPTKIRASRPALNPVQPMPLPIRNFAPFQDPLTKIKRYISKPLVGDTDMKEGYIYGFQLDGKPYTKIGLAATRKGEPSLDECLKKRMEEHKDCGWHDVKIVLKHRVHHVHRMETIIHYHLESGRMKEINSCTPLNGRDCKHKTHREWFNNSLDEITTVVIAWKYWINCMPYGERDGDRHLLNPEWISRLGHIRNEFGRDNLLGWLCHHVPEVPRSITKVALNNTEWVEDESVKKSTGSFVRNSATGKNFEIKRSQTCLV